MSVLNAFTLFGQQFEWSVSTAVLILMLVQIALVALALVIFALLMVRKYLLGRSKQNILVEQAKQPETKRELVGITLDTAVVQREFRVGDIFNSDGLVVTANYSGEPSSETVTDFIVEAPPMYEEGKPSVTVRYGEFSAFYTVAVLPAEEARRPVGIALDTSSVQREFYVGEAFNCNGLVVRVDFDRPPFGETVENYEVDEPSTETEGETYVAIRYGGLVATYPVTVVKPAEERHPVGIALDVSVVKTDFIVGEAFDSAGLGVMLCFNAEPAEVPVTDFTVETPDLSREGMINVVVRYGEFTQTYPIFVTEGRSLVDISLDTAAVRRAFVAGEAFDCAGLVVTAQYDAPPFTEQVTDYTVETPDMSAEGEQEVLVRYEGKEASYSVSVAKPEPVEGEESAEPGVLRYDKSFTARLIQSDDDTKQWYTVLKNELLSYKKVKDRMSWKRETYRLGREAVAKFGFRGKSLCLFLPLDPAEYAESRYKVEDVSANKSFEDTPCMYRIKNERRVRRACELIAVVLERLGSEKTERIAEDYYVPYEGIYELVNKGLAKRIFVGAADFGSMGKTEAEEEIAADVAPRAEEPTAEPAIAPLILEEESYEGGTLRYDKSFKAKLIQSDDDTKRYYSAIKNELLSYKKVKDRLSWKRETYKAAGGCVAKIGYRGNTLCIYLPLNVAEYEGTRYKVEDASSNKSSADTPCMFRIKNEKRLRLAYDLIARVMEERGLQRIERAEVDYYEPYQDIVKLIGQGLVRREIKSKEEESLFNKGGQTEEPAE